MNKPLANIPVYSVIGVWFQGEEHATLLAMDDKILVFDTPQMARDYLPRLGSGRRTLWDGEDNVCWAELTPDGINRAVVLWDYDPYDAPYGRSESRLHEWQHHVIWTVAVLQEEAQRQQMVKAPTPAEWMDRKRNALRGVIARI
jgi:hypothetical protein